MTTNSIPTDLRVYYCSYCDALLFTNKLLDKDGTESSSCRSCGYPDLDLLEKNSFQTNSDYLSIPYPQRLLVKRFFDYSHDRVLLLTKFSQVPPLDILSQSLDEFELITEITVEISPALEAVASALFEDGTKTIAKGTVQLLIQHFEEEN